jgi:flagellar assembly protein FliH
LKSKILKTTDSARRPVLEFSTQDLARAASVAENTFGETEIGAQEPFDPEELRESVLAEAREEARQKVEGQKLGQEAGEAQFRASVAEAATALEAAAEAMRAAREAFLDGLEAEVVTLATLIAERVLDREVRSDPTLVKATARRALGVLADRQKLRLRVNPADLDALNAHKLSLLHDFSGIVSIDVAPDPTVGPGGCMADSETMGVDARLETLLSEVLDSLRD